MLKIKSGSIFLFLVDNLIWVLVIISLVVFSVLSESFFKPFNLVNTLLRVAAARDHARRREARLRPDLALLPLDWRHARAQVQVSDLRVEETVVDLDSHLHRLGPFWLSKLLRWTACHAVTVAVGGSGKSCGWLRSCS